MAERARVLIVDDQASMVDSLVDGLEESGYEAVASTSSRAAMQRLETERFDAVVTDLRMPEIDGLTLLAHARKLERDRPVIVMTAYSAVDSAIESIRQGAFHYLTKPFKLAELVLFLERALEDWRLRREATTLRRALGNRDDGLIGESGAMQQVYDLVQRVGGADAPVLVLGETGTGKGMIARAVHAHSDRRRGPFVTVNCAAVPEALLESELFGHVRGAFTGATSRRVGLFEEATRGTLFLDEIAEMSPALQAKLLRVLESGLVRAVGADREREVDVRIIAATHRDLRERAAAGAFREDLFYRLDVLRIELPALRHRREDLPLLVDHFIARARAKHRSSRVERISPDALEKLAAHSWPGNVRELQHVVERAVLLGESDRITLADIPATVSARDEGATTFRGEVLPLREIQRRYAAWAYEELGGKKVLTAQKLDVDFRTLSKLLAAPESE